MTNTRLTMRFKKVTAAICAISLQFAAAAPSFAAQKAARFHPGHYIYLSTGPIVDSDFSMSPKFRGVQRQYLWSDLEATEGHYTFGSIGKDLADLNGLPTPKKLIVQLQTKAFGTGRTTCPADLKGSAKNGGGNYSGTYINSTKALDPVFWDPAVKRRLANLYAHLGAYLTNNSNVNALEAVCLSESAVSESPAGLAAQKNVLPYTDQSYIDALTNGFNTLNSYLPNTIVIQYTNYIIGTSGLAQLVANEQAAGVGLGGPDLCPPQYGQPGLQLSNNGVYRDYLNEHNANGRNFIPLGTAVQPADAVGDPKVTFNFGQSLNLNYIFWLKNETYLPKVAAMLNNDVPASDPAGGLNSRYPESISPLQNTER